MYVIIAYSFNEDNHTILDTEIPDASTASEYVFEYKSDGIPAHSMTHEEYKKKFKKEPDLFGFEYEPDFED